MTPDQKIQIQYLLSQYLNGTITAIEERRLFTYIDEETDNTAWHELLEEFMAAEQATIINPAEYQPILDRILKRPGVVTDRLQAEGAKVKRMGWVKWVAAAAIITVIVGAFWWIRETANGKRQTNTETAQAHDVPAPSNTRAVITLANGSKVYLDSVNTGTIAQENNVNVIKNGEGGISYQNAAGAGGMSPAGGGGSGRRPETGVDYNTLFNPRGSKVISLTLSDGTRVWLNSESSLKYPIAFNDNTREVEITGEAYFEVTHNSKQPFKVHLPNGSVVEDIGTSFNINAYPDEETTKTTLIEGSVKITSRLSAFVAKPKPGEQVIDKPNSPLTTQHTLDIDEVLSWKNGKFSYTATDIKTIMKDVARWYDVDIVFDGDINEKFYADVPRNTNVSTLLKMLEITKAVHFKVEGKRITVSK